MRKKKIRKALASRTPINSIYSLLVPAQQREAFKKFAAGFGFTEEKINQLLKQEMKG